MSSPPGPKSCSRAFSSKFSAAATSASAACCGVAKLFAAVAGAEVVVGALFAAVCCATERPNPHIQENAVTPTIKRSPWRFRSANIAFMRCSYSSTSASPAYLRRPPPPPRAPPPPPRDPMLEEPRLLLARALDPLYPLEPLEPPPKASRFPPPPRETSRLPMRSAPPPPGRLPAPPPPAARLLTPAPPARLLGRLPPCRPTCCLAFA